MSTDLSVNRRQLLRLVGAGIVAGSLGTGTASANDRGRYVVGTASPAAERAVRARAASVRRSLDFGRFGRAVAGVFTHDAARALARRSDVRYVEPDIVLRAIAIDAGDAEVPWGVDRVDAEKVHVTATGSGADVAIVDTGIDNDHGDLVGNLGSGVSFVGGGPFNSKQSTDPKDWDDGNGHGTHCAGIAAAVDDGAGVVGVATAPTLHAVKVLDDRGSGYASDIAAGIEYTAKQGWHVASLSLGGGYSQAIHDACKFAYIERGVLVVAAAGNSGAGTADDHYPSAHDEVIAVGATDDLDAIASFSSTGITVELGAPGVDVYSTYAGGGHTTLSGTSMACPHVSGAAAILMAGGLKNADSTTNADGSTNVDTPGGTRGALRDSAENVGLTAEQVGYGLLDVEKAVTGTSTDSGSTDDTTAPAAPTLSEDDTQRTDTSVTLAWTEPADSDLGGYTLYQKLDSATDWAVQGTYDVGTNSATVTGLSAETTYDFAVTATDSSGNESAKSNVVTVTTNASSTDGTTLAFTTFSLASLSPNNPHAEVETTWEVAGSPDDVTLEVDGQTFSGLGASGTHVYQEKHTSGTYTVTMTATKGSEAVTVSDSIAA